MSSSSEAQQQLKVQQAQLKQLELQHTWLKELREWQHRQRDATEQLHSAQKRTGIARANNARTSAASNNWHRSATSSHAEAELLGMLTPLAAQIQASNTQQTELLTRQAAWAQRSNRRQARIGRRGQPASRRRAAAATGLRRTEHPRCTWPKTWPSATTDKQRQQSACTEGQNLLKALQEKQAAVTERLQRLAAGLAAQRRTRRRWAMPGTVYRERLQQLMLIGNRLNKGQAELPQLEQRATAAAATVHPATRSPDLLYQEAGAEPHAVAEQIQLLPACCKTIASNSVPSKTSRACGTASSNWINSPAR